MYSRCVKRVFYSAFVRKCTDMCKHRFGVQLLQNPPLCSSTTQSWPWSWSCSWVMEAVKVMVKNHVLGYGHGFSKVMAKNHVLGHGRGCSQGYGLESCSWSWSLLYSRLFG
jgi:hypothetical protein